MIRKVTTQLNMTLSDSTCLAQRSQARAHSGK
jgi:hypothetical protein